jgi:hypothetical protein
MYWLNEAEEDYEIFESPIETPELDYIEELEKKNGSVMFNGEKYIFLHSQAYAADSRREYYCKAIKSTDLFKEKIYNVIWDTKDQWNASVDGYDDPDSEYFQNSYVEDESNACDWESPSAVVEVD